MKVVFLDRDGVINKYPGDTKYVTSLKTFRFLPKAKDAIARLTRKGFRMFVISNQAGVGKGEFSKKSLDRITRKMLLDINRAGGKIEEVFYCLHRKEENCGCRKPMAGSVYLAKRKYHLNLKHAFFIGDTIRDVKTAKAVKITSVLLLCGKEKLKYRLSWEAQPDFIFTNLWRAVEFIIEHPRSFKKRA